MLSVAVVIPVFNRGDFLEKALTSVLRQSRQPQEIIVVDDGSTEDISPLVSGSDRVQMIRLPENRGPAAARNAGVKAANSEWLTFLDSDDEWLPGKLDRQASWHEGNPQFRVSQVHEKWFWNGEERVKPPSWEQRGGDLFSHSVERCAIGPSCVMLTRDLWEELGGFDEFFRVCEDYELWLRLCRREAVGLVPGDALVKKAGGHEDQLSTSTPAMDRFRVCALLQLLERGELSESKSQTVSEGICKKASILAAGAEKRGNLEMATGFRVLSKIRWESTGNDERRRWVDWSRSQCSDRDKRSLTE